MREPAAILVTGASSGIGRATAELLAARGFRVFGASRRTPEPPPVGSPYEERLRRAERVVRESLPKAPGPAIVAAVVWRALTARRPRVRYAVGPDSLLVPLARRLLPDWLSLALIRDHFDV